MNEGEYLTREEAEALPDGARVEVKWSGGNGPHEYVVRRFRDVVYVVVPDPKFRGIEHRLDFVGTEPPFTIVRRLTPRMSDGEALLRAILERPEEDTPRLMYADWLQEHDDEERAEFIRVQVELATHISREVAGVRHYHAATVGTAELEHRERELLTRIPALKCAGFMPVRSHDYFGALPIHRTAAYRRGFIESISAPLAAFMEHAKSLFSAHPIERVTLKDRVALGREPEDQIEPWCSWWLKTHEQDRPHYLPAEIYERLNRGERYGIFRRYPASESDDATDLSHACVAYGRSLAGLSLAPVEGWPGPGFAPIS